jgi:mRNA interferase RelE/StbE
MSKSSVELTPVAAKQLRKMAHEVQVRISKAIDKLSINPFPAGFKKLSGQKDLYRIRTGDYRIVYQFNSGKLIILIVRIGHRKDIYPS